jgi:thioredoxin reductase (NADPH)
MPSSLTQISDTLWDMVIVGAGPAGLTAGLYASRTGRKALILEQYSPGGQAAQTWQVDNYPGVPHVNGAELIMRMENQAREFGMNIIMTQVTGIVPGSPLTLLTSKGEVRAKTVILAVGAIPKTLDIPGESEYKGRGVSYCATCDGAFFRDVPVAVIGGGNTALEEAEFLTRFASRIYLIHRREQFRADKILQDRILTHPKIKVITAHVPSAILGNAQGVTTLVYGPRNQAECLELSVKGVFVFVGWTPQTAWLKELLDLDDSGYIITNEKLETRIPGVYAAGDCRANMLKQIIVANGEGALAAMMAERRLQAQ